MAMITHPCPWVQNTPVQLVISAYTIGYATYDGVGANKEGNHIGANISWDAVTFGIGSSNNETSASTHELKLFLTASTMLLATILTVGQSGQVKSENKMGNQMILKQANTTIGVAYSIAPGLTFSMSSHNYDYKESGTTKNDGSAIQSELKMSF